MSSTTALINGTAYSFADIDINILGAIVEGFTAISYGVRRTKTNNYGRRELPTSRSRGNKEFEGSITLEMKEVQRIMALLPAGKDLTDIAPFPIIVSFVNDDNIQVNHKLLYCEFTEQMIDSSQNDPAVYCTCPLIIGQIIYS